MRGAVAVGLLAALIWVASGAGAGAHAAAPASAPQQADLLVDATPGPGEVVPAAPTTITLEFADPIVAGSVAIRVFDTDGTLRAVAGPAVAGSIVTAAVELLAEGRYLVDWDVTGVSAGPASGAYRFGVDPSGTGALSVSRAVDEGGLLVRLTRLAAFVAASAGIGMLVVALLAAARPAPSPSARLAALVAGAASLVGFLAAASVAEGSVGAVVSPSAWSATAASMTGAMWLLAGLPMLAVPYLMLRSADVGSGPAPRPVLAAVAGVAIVGVVGAAVGTYPADRVGVGVLVVAGATAAAIATTPRSRVPALVAGAACAVAFGALTAGGVGGAVGERATFDGIALELDVAPGRVGVNELHVYGFDTVAGGLATLDDAVAWASLPGLGVGPIEIEMLRAGPNHFLTYTAELPLEGEWQIEFQTATENNDDLSATIMVDTR